MLICALLFGASGAVSAQDLWLVVGASDSNPAGIARKAKAASQDRAAGLVFNARDCGDKRAVFGWAVEIAENEPSAKDALARAPLEGAYLKRCKVRPGSLLALRYAAVDPTIADVPDDAVNWSEEDRVSSAIALSEGRVAVVVRYYHADPNDDMEGRRQRLIVVGPDHAVTPLMDACAGFGRVRACAGKLTFHCATEQAADQDLHSTFVFDATGRKLAEVPRCREPAWATEHVVKCSEESIGVDGMINVRPKQVRIP